MPETLSKIADHPSRKPPLSELPALAQCLSAAGPPGGLHGHLPSKQLHSAIPSRSCLLTAMRLAGLYRTRLRVSFNAM